MPIPRPAGPYLRSACHNTRSPNSFHRDNESKKVLGDGDVLGLGEDAAGDFEVVPNAGQEVVEESPIPEGEMMGDERIGVAGDDITDAVRVVPFLVGDHVGEMGHPDEPVTSSECSSTARGS